MKVGMFVIYDSKANAYLQPWFLSKREMATRVFSDCVNDPEHNFGRHPEDYTLFEIGDFDDQDAQVFWNSPVALGNGLVFVKVEAADEQRDLFKGDGHAISDGAPV